MAFLIDRNILSEVQKGERTDPGVRDWYAGVNFPGPPRQPEIGDHPSDIWT